MPKIDQLIIDKIHKAAKIEEVVKECLGEYSSEKRSGLKKAGVRYKALCPFHDDKSLGSFIVYPKGNCYKCFSCGEKGGVIDFLMKYERLSYPDAIRWLGKKYGINIDQVDINWTYTPRPLPPPLPVLELPKRIMGGTLTPTALANDNLINWIRTGIAWDAVQRKRMEEMIAVYRVGHGKNGHTIFWQMDERERLRTGKMMKYRPDGHRDKEAAWNFDFIHSTLIRHWDAERHEMTDEPPYPFPQLYDPDKEEHELTFFGMHLLNCWKRKDIDQAVCIVESEKTALLMAIAYGNHAKQVWMACGGLEMLNRDRLKPITDQRRRIILYPDRDGITKWKQKAEQLHYDRLSVDTRPVTEWWRPEDGEKADIADVVIRMINNSKELHDMQELEKAMPQVMPLVNKLNLEIINDEGKETYQASSGDQVVA